MLALILVITILNLGIGFLAVVSAGRNFIEREADRDTAIAQHNAVVGQVNKLAANVGWQAEEVQSLLTTFELEREAK